MHLSKVGRFELLHVSLVCDEFCLSLSRICHENVCHNSRLTSLKEQWRQWKPQPSDYWDDMGWLSVTIDYVDDLRKELRLRDLLAPCAQLPSSLGPGRTMSLAPAMQISSIHQALRRCRCQFGAVWSWILHIFAYLCISQFEQAIATKAKCAMAVVMARDLCGLKAAISTFHKPQCL